MHAYYSAILSNLFFLQKNEKKSILSTNTFFFFKSPNNGCSPLSTSRPTPMSFYRFSFFSNLPIFFKKGRAAAAFKNVCVDLHQFRFSDESVFGAGNFSYLFFLKFFLDNSDHFTSGPAVSSFAASFFSRSSSLSFCDFHKNLIYRLRQSMCNFSRFFSFTQSPKGASFFLKKNKNNFLSLFGVLFLNSFFTSLGFFFTPIVLDSFLRRKKIFVNGSVPSSCYLPVSVGDVISFDFLFCQPFFLRSFSAPFAAKWSLTSKSLLYQSPRVRLFRSFEFFAASLTFVYLGIFTREALCDATTNHDFFFGVNWFNVRSYSWLRYF